MAETKKIKLPRWITKLVDRLNSKPEVAGLQITNGGLEYVFSEGKRPLVFSVKFAPDTVKDGRLLKHDDFVAVAKKLYELVDDEKKKKRLQITVSLPAPVVYTQSFSVPNIDKEKLEESARLNLQMLSPVPKDQAYMSYEVIGETPDKYDLLGAFVEKKIVDDFRVALTEANFFPIAFEFPSLSLTRLISKNLTLEKHPSLVMYVSSDGIDFFIIRDGSLLFDYFRSWQSIQGEATTIQKELFLSTVVSETQKVSNFVLSRYKERLEKVYLATPALETEITDALRTQTGVEIQPLAVPSLNLPASWYVAFGASVRNFDQSDAASVNLNFESAGDIFFQEHALGFLYFWRRLGVAVGLFFFAAFLIASSFLGQQLKALKGQFDSSRTQANAQELTNLKSQAVNFNATIAELNTQPRQLREWSSLMVVLGAIAKQNSVTIDRVAVTSFASPITMAAEAPNNDATLAFKNALVANPGFSKVDVPLLSIHEQADGSVGFLVNFTVDIASVVAQVK